MRKINSKLSPTQLRDYRKKRKEEEKENIEKMGSETESEGRKATQEIMEKERKVKEKEAEDSLNLLDMRRKSILTYRETLMIALHSLVLDIGMPKEYQWGVWFDGNGIVIAIMDKSKVLHRRAFIPSRDPLVDRNAIHTLSHWAEEVYDQCEGNLHQIWTPPKKN